MNLNPKNINIVVIVSFFCKDTLFYRKMQGIFGKCLRMSEITRKMYILAGPMCWARRIYIRKRLRVYTLHNSKKAVTAD